jgi:N-acetylated-alpha-linked acidic dipeptidase
MPLTNDEKAILADIALDAPWELVEAFSTMHRWRPEDVNKGADAIGKRLRGLGIPFEMHKPTIYLSVPLDATVKLGRKTFRAKPPSMCASVAAVLEDLLRIARVGAKLLLVRLS